MSIHMFEKLCAIIVIVFMLIGLIIFLDDMIRDIKYQRKINNDKDDDY